MKLKCSTCRHLAKRPVLFSFTFALFCFYTLAIWRNADYVYDLGTVEGWEYNTSRDARLYIHPQNATTILLPQKFCNNKTDLLIVISSTPNNFESRRAIRETWGSVRNIENFIVHIYFLIGQSRNETFQDDIVEEFHKHNDVLQEQFIDSYNNLTLKSLMALKLVKTHCMKNVKFVMKTDDDMFVNVPTLVKLLRTKQSTKVLVGHLIHKATPVRDSTSKWKAPLYLYRDEVYPDYLSGTGYIMSLDVVSNLYEASFTVPIYYLEDVYITGILSKAVKMKPKNHEGFTYSKRKMDPCLYSTAITSHHMNATEIRTLFDMISKTNFIRCKKKRPTKRLPKLRFSTTFSKN